MIQVKLVEKVIRNIIIITSQLFKRREIVFDKRRIQNSSKKSKVKPEENKQWNVQENKTER